MFSTKTAVVLGVVALGSAVLVCQTSGQVWTGGDRSVGAASQPDPEAIKKMMADYKKKADEQRRQTLGATEEEWTVLEPKFDKVQKLSNEIRFGAMMMGFGMARMGGPSAEQQSELQTSTQALSKVLQDKNATAGEIKTALQAYRDAKTKAKAALEQAQKELKEVLSVRQEALLVQMGLLE
jgi:ribosomal protein L10